MLSTSHNTSTSGIQTRRRQQLQRQSQPRQESLEVPQLVTQLPGVSATSTPQQSPTRHSRGPSEDERLQSTTLSPTFGRLTTDQEGPNMDNTNTGRPSSQHSNMQGAQQHSAAQPGQRHPQLQMQQQQHQQRTAAFAPGMIDPRLAQQMMQEQQTAVRRAMAAAQQPPPEQAMHKIQNDIKHFYEQYPQYIGTSPTQMLSPQLDMSPARSPVMQLTGSATPVLIPGTSTPPNAFLPSPPSTQNGSRRGLRKATAVPMPVSFGAVPMLALPQSGAAVDMQLFQDAASGTLGIHEYGYSTPYQSSLVDPNSPHMSPERDASLRSMSMPALFDDEGMAASGHVLQPGPILVGAGGVPYYYAHPDSPIRMPLSPREQMLAQLEVDATIEDTGISPEEVAKYISEQDPADMKYTCLFPECGKQFGRKENVRSHVQTHLGDRQFRCNHCGKCFVRQHDLKRHAKIHSGDKPHKCPCGNGFARQDALTRHRQRGVCHGALPGFERREVKRGRPRKNRPDLSERLDKAARARRMDAEDNFLDHDLGAYSSSSPSDSGSDPYTPPPMNDVEDMQTDLTTNAGLEAFIRAYRDTPPTSPAATNLTGGASPHSSWQNNSFDGAFDLNVGSARASASPQHSPISRSRGTSPAQMEGATTTTTTTTTATFDFAGSPKQERQPTPALPHDSPVAATAVVTGEELLGMSTASGSQPEPSPFTSSSDYGFDWAAIEAQPALVTDPFSPAAMTSPAATDLFGDNDALEEAWDLGQQKHDAHFGGGFGGKVGVMVGAEGDLDGRVDELFADLIGDVSWAN